MYKGILTLFLKKKPLKASNSLCIGVNLLLFFKIVLIRLNNPLILSKSVKKGLLVI